MTFTPHGNSTATLSGAPSAGTEGSYSFTITAENGYTSVQQTFTLNIFSTEDHLLRITSPDHTVFLIGEDSLFTITTDGLPYPEIQLDGDLPDGIVFEDLGNGTATLSGTASGAEGTYSFIITANNGVDSDTQSFTLNIVKSVDNFIRITSPKHTTFLVGEESSFIITTDGEPNPEIKFFGNLPDGITFKDNHDGTATLSGTPVLGTEGTYPLAITAENEYDSDVQIFTLYVVDVKDTFVHITSSDHTVFIANQENTFSIETEGLPYPTIELYGSLPEGIQLIDNGNGTASLKGTPPIDAEGVYSLTLIAHNSFDSDVQIFTLLIITNNETDVSIISPNHTAFLVGEESLFTIITAGFPYPEIQLEGDLPDGIAFEDLGNGTATLSGTPSAGTEGSHSLTITANNGVDSDTQSFTLNIVDSAEYFIRITSENHTTFLMGEMGTFTITTEGNSNPSIQLLGNLPDNLTFIDQGDGTSILSGTPASGTEGIYLFTIVAENEYDTDVQTFTLFVISNDEAKVTIISPDHTAFLVGEEKLFTIITVGFPYPEIQLEGDLPEGITFTDLGNGTAALNGIPIFGTGGTYELTITAKNALGEDSQTFILTVYEAPHIISASEATYNAGKEAEFIIEAIGFPLPAITCVNIPEWAECKDLGNGTATFSVNPPSGTNGTYTITINATNSFGSDAQEFILTISNDKDDGTIIFLPLIFR